MNEFYYIAAISLGGFMLVMFLIGWPLASIGGWRQLAKAYPCDGPIEGTRWRFQSAALRWVNYSAGLEVTVNSEGLRMAICFPFTWTPLNPTHAPFFLPWSEINVSRKPVLGGLFEEVRMVTQREPTVPVTIEAKLAQRIKDAIGPAWPEPI
jgi:hypothetical protein